MKDEDKRRYLESYHKAKEGGEEFFPFAVFRDALVALLLFLLLIALAYFLGAPLEARADPNDAGYTPRPEWYFLFLFQLLKYFPGRLEIIGVFLLPTLAIALILALPLLDRSPRRHFLGRPVVSVLAVLGLASVLGLTGLAAIETPPPAAPTAGDPVAALYAANCAGCHGPTVEVAANTNLHEVIAQGSHTGMPAWSGDLTSDQIDALAGFILSPEGSEVFNRSCAACHSAPALVAGDPLELKNMLDQGPDYPAHEGQDVPNWQEGLQPAERTALLNFLAAPDGQRLFATNCSSCHGRAVSFSGDEAALREIIRQGGLHLEMPPWQTRLNEEEIEVLASYVVDPQGAEGSNLFGTYCSSCHGQRVPAADSVEQARLAIAEGGAHQTMPIWGEVLTQEQLDALTSYTFSAGQEAPLEVGRELFAQNCAPCHGDFGEGGPNPSRPGDIIAPISSAEYLQTRDDETLAAIIAQGQPNFGMSPFGVASGGPLDEGDIDALVAFLRAWEVNPPVELPPELPPHRFRQRQQITPKSALSAMGPGARGAWRRP
jgi:mono/diheme cytochrome c family protein